MIIAIINFLWNLQIPILIPIVGIIIFKIKNFIYKISFEKLEDKILDIEGLQIIHNKQIQDIEGLQIIHNKQIQVSITNINNTINDLIRINLKDLRILIKDNQSINNIRIGELKEKVHQLELKIK